MKCKCGKECVLKENMFHLRGNSFSGWVCECNALYENKEDSMFKFAKGKKTMDFSKIALTPQSNCQRNCAERMGLCKEGDIILNRDERCTQMYIKGKWETFAIGRVGE